MRSLRRLVVLSVVTGVVVAAGIATARWVSDRDRDGGWSIAVNRAWVERMPRTPRDMTRKIAFIHDDGERVGVVVNSSEFRLFLDVFFWVRRDGDNRVKMTFPQVQKDRLAAVRAWKCKGEAPRPFELCMELKDAQGDRRMTFYSMEEWEIGRSADVNDRAAPWNQFGDVEDIEATAADSALDTDGGGVGEDTDDAFPSF